MTISLRQLLQNARPYVEADSGNRDRTVLLALIDTALEQPPAAWMNSYGCVISNRAHAEWGAKDRGPGEIYDIPLYR
jgi:hypothetical protein